MSDIYSILDQQLTPEQLAAVVDESEDILIIACAGSGKSRTLAYRIAWLISQGADPASIIAFTFTDKAAESIQQRVATALEKTGHRATEIGKIRIGTIHGFCRDILIRSDARYRQFEVLDPNALRLFLMSRYHQLGMKTVRNRKKLYFKCIEYVAAAWETLHDEGLEMDSIRKHDEQLGEIIARINESLDKSNYYDFSLMIRLVVDRLEQNDTDILNSTRGFRHILVDEYQDINPIQERLINLLRRSSESLVVVGDDDQSIYGWRGADVQNIVNFRKRNPAAKQHTLAHNFRSTPLIVKTADDFVKAELGASRLPKDPSADQGQGSYQMGVFGFTDRPSEADWVADRIAALIGTPYAEEDGIRGLTPADFAILMRSTKSQEQDQSSRSLAFTKSLEERGISYTLEAGGSVFSREHVSLLREAMELLRSGTPDCNTVLGFLHQKILPLFPKASEFKSTDLYARWGREIHTPINVERRRVYPQRLLHDLLFAFDIAHSDLDEGTMADIGVLSKFLQDVETVYVSVDTAQRYREILNFMSEMAETRYQTATDLAIRRPDAVTVSTVHKAKGLEYPVVFVVDAEQQRFPTRQSQYDGWIPRILLKDALDPPRRAYSNGREQEARLFYTALTRAERFLYVTHATQLPGGKRKKKESPFSARLDAEGVLRDAPNPSDLPPSDLPPSHPRRRIDETVLPTTFSEIRYYLRCPRDYKYRHVWGFSPPIPEMFGFGQTVHAAIGKLHERYPDRVPTSEEADAIAREIFHLKHVPPSRDPDDQPGPYERGKDASAQIVRTYASDYHEDFEHRRQLEVPFEIPLRDSVLSGSIDLLLHLDAEGQTLDANVIDFKAMEGGPTAEDNPRLDWTDLATDLALQVQLYAQAATTMLDANARTGAVHLLRDSQRIAIPIDDAAVDAAVKNVEWAADRIIAGDFPMRPHPQKCEGCDWAKLCPKQPESFATDEEPPLLHLPNGSEAVRAFSQVQPPPST